MRVYFDTSALAKLYVLESGSEIALKHCADADEMVTSCIVVPELMSALNRRKRELVLTKSQYDHIKREFLLDIAETMIVDLTPQVIKTAVESLEETTLRAFDAIHIASALVSDANLFVSADQHQCQAAKRMRLDVVCVI